MESNLEKLNQLSTLVSLFFPKKQYLKNGLNIGATRRSCFVNNPEEYSHEIYKEEWKWEGIDPITYVEYGYKSHLDCTMGDYQSNSSSIKGVDVAAFYFHNTMKFLVFYSYDYDFSIQTYINEYDEESQIVARYLVPEKQCFEECVSELFLEKIIATYSYIEIN
jgi:hypothetical protein